LGGIVAHSRLGKEVIAKVNRSIRRSVEYANLHKGELNEFVRCNAQEMSTSVMQQHIDLYVNEFSVSLGEQGQKAIIQMFDYAIQTGVIASKPENIFASRT
jgi:1,4-dihydroxy-6-naphthoate synthase